MNIKHYRFTEISSDLKKLSKMGKRLYVFNIRGHGDNYDDLNFFHCQYWHDKNKGYYLTYKNPDGTGTLNFLDDDHDTRVVGYLDLEDDPTLQD